jgi:aspartyl-tRNA(Asn)/glutamyl-tRNA(Gln) amidotransferase subunit B
MPKEDYIVTIGLEVHCQINTESKMFCGCKAGYGYEPNTNVCPVCLGLPGALPVLNKYAIEQTILAGLLLNCEISQVSKWDRKSYFYPDMPKNYQLTQFDLPLCKGGGVPLYSNMYHLEVQKQIVNLGKVVKMNRIHLEEDVAKLTHQAKSSIIDFNRAGTPLMEIVTEPDIDSAEEAYAFLKSLQQIMRYGGISDADMEKGQMRCDVNISLRKRGEHTLGTKLEIKNLNSISNVRAAIYYEMERQSEILDQGGRMKQATLRWDPNVGVTSVMREKEDSHDYRYFPEPDLLPVRAGDLVERMRSQVPELPHEKIDRFVREYGVSPYDAGVLSSELVIADYFESAVKEEKPLGKKVANWVINALLGKLNQSFISFEDGVILAETLLKIVKMVEVGSLSNNQAKEVFEFLWNNPDREPSEVAKELGFEPADTNAVEVIIDAVIAANPEKVEQIKSGNPKLANWLTGEVMKASKGKANPKMVTDTIVNKLGL